MRGVLAQMLRTLLAYRRVRRLRCEFPAGCMQLKSGELNETSPASAKSTAQRSGAKAYDAVVFLSCSGLLVGGFAMNGELRHAKTCAHSTSKSFPSSAMFEAGVKRSTMKKLTCPHCSKDHGSSRRVPDSCVGPSVYLASRCCASVSCRQTRALPGIRMRWASCIAPQPYSLYGPAV